MKTYQQFLMNGTRHRERMLDLATIRGATGAVEPMGVALPPVAIEEETTEAESAATEKEQG
jgi:hypothetical protein